MIDSLMFFIPFQTLYPSCLWQSNVGRFPRYFTFSIQISRLSSPRPRPGWCFLAGRPQGRFQAWLPTARHLCQPLERANWSPLAQQHRALRLPAVQPSSLCVAPSPAAWVGLHHHGHRVHLLGLFLLLRTLPGIPQAWVRLNPALLIILFPPVSAFTWSVLCVQVKAGLPKCPLQVTRSLPGPRLDLHFDLPKEDQMWIGCNSHSITWQKNNFDHRSFM